jgi:hypothetical protein
LESRQTTNIITKERKEPITKCAKKWQKQIPLMPQIKDHAKAKELEVISDIIDGNPIICDRVLQDLNKGKLIAYRKGADGMSADQVLRCAIVKMPFRLSPMKTWPFISSIRRH